MSYDGVLGGFLGHGKAGLAIIGKYGILKIPPKEIHGKLQGHGPSDRLSTSEVLSSPRGFSIH
jgi:hypothetical protein